MRWYRKAAEQGNAYAQSNLGVMFENGLGVAKNYVEAHKWHVLASTAGYADDDRAITRVASMMTPAQISEAQRPTRECFAKNYKGC